MQVLEDLPGAETVEGVHAKRRRDVAGQGEILCRSELGAVIRGVGAHVDEGVLCVAFGLGSRAREPAHVPDCVARRVEQGEGHVAEEVEGRQAAYFEGLGFEINRPGFSACEV